jgi:hypothetical protein
LKERKICYVCNKEIEEGEPFFFIGKGKDRIKLYRHDNDEHTQVVLDNFTFRTRQKGEQIG